MFPNESSSDEISAESSDAFVQNRKEPAEHRGVFGGVTATSFDSQHPVCPVDQVPVSRESIVDHILSGASSDPSVVVVATGNNLDKAEENFAQVLSVAPKTTQVVYSKEQVQPEVAMTEEGVTQERATRFMMHTVAAAKAAGPCDPKSEAEPQGEVVKSDPASAKLSASVIFPSSRCGEVAPPSLHKGSDRTSQEAQLGFNASHLGSSSSRSLHCAQSHKPLDTQANSDPKINTSQVPLTTPQSPCNKENHLIQRYTTKVKDEEYKDYATTRSDGPNVRRGDQGAALQEDKFSLSNPNIPRNRLHGPATNVGWGIPRGLGLRGGGENSLNNGTSGWGTPPAGAANSSGWGQNTTAQNANAGATSQWGAAARPGPPAGPNGQPNKGSQSPPQSAQLQPTQQPIQPTAASGSQQGNGGQQQQNQPPSQQASQPGGASGNGQGAQAPNGSPSWAQAAGGAGGNGPGKGPGQPPGPNGGGAATAKQLEQINSMREALLSQDGWGGQHVNQDTGWDIPSSPEPGMKEGGWKPNVNNGTDLWEANLRNGGQPPPQPVAKTPWGHTPSTNIGGTWGEDDDTADTANMWQGVPNNNPSGPQWNSGPAAMQKKESDWSGGGGGGSGGGGGGGGGGGSTWGDARDMRGMGMDPRASERDMRGGMGMDMRSDMMRPDMMMNPRGPDPRIGGGRMNGEAPMWGAPKGQQPPVNQWGGPPPKDMKGNPSGWEEPSPPAQRRQAPNYDDGTSLWGNPGNPQPPTWRGGPQKTDAGKVSHWKDIPHPGMGGRGSGMQCPPGMAQGRGMPGAGGMKPDVPMWGHPQRNGSWDGPQGPHDGPGGWGDESSKMGWNDQNMMPQGSWGGLKPKNPMGGGWGDGTEVDPSSWGHPKPGPKPLTKDMIWASKQFRLMTEMNLGYKKDDIENALRTTSMNMEDAIELLNNMRDGYRRSDEHSFDLGGSSGPHPGGPGSSGYPGRGGYNPPQQMPFAPPGPGVNNAPSLMNNANNPSLPSINTMSPAIVQKILTQQPPPAAAAAQPSTQQPFQSVQRTPLSQPQPSAAQLRMLVQQIQTAVQSGHLNPQILNQPLAPQTLQLLNQLLNQIKLQHSLVQQQTLISLQPLTKQQSQNHLQISVQITKTKQTIGNLQNQIAAQQALFVKQQSMNSGGPQADFFPKQPPMSEPAMSLDVGLSHLSMKEPQSQQSRLNQWIKPDKDSDVSMNEFDRAPGNSKSQSHTSPNMNPLLGQGDSTWSSVGRGAGDSGWPDSSADLGGGNQNDSTNTFEVPEFEPGKPWKGSNLKNFEDDPTLTPGSVMASPLSATIKDSVFSSKTSPPSSIVSSATDTMSSVGLSNPTWSYNSGSSGSAFASLSNNGSGPRTSGTGSSWGAGGWGGGSTWLRLSNLTPQIDGSTLKTLCLQHGPLLNFHLYLNHGFAMAKYQTREEAAKAQGALNNCVLGNTTIFAESPAESEVHSLVSQLHSSQSQGPGPGPNSGGWGSMRPGSGPGSGPNSGSGQGGSGGVQGSQPTKPPPDTWGGSTGGSSNQLWSAPSSASSLWGAPPLDGGDQHRATPSSLNSYLPGDLLGEGM
ncbi:protein Gawky isoform X3 [Neocloeon triangulifer]|uniref:protein Gawky isoform X3 n=1 Tax=Neocloeon triangulifer TaxID=2078957 RepID=UPI00286F12BD|nr:protein Gawky isoform X3 [Neocloeon triangulifer]